MVPVLEGKRCLAREVCREGGRSLSLTLALIFFILSGLFSTAFLCDCSAYYGNSIRVYV